MTVNLIATELFREVAEEGELAHLPAHSGQTWEKNKGPASGSLRKMAGSTRLELATSGVTGRRSNQLNYDPAWGTSSAMSG